MSGNRTSAASWLCAAIALLSAMMPGGGTAAEPQIIGCIGNAPNTLAKTSPTTIVSSCVDRSPDQIRPAAASPMGLNT